MYEPYTKPFAHQQLEWEHSRDRQGYAIFWEQGTGKSKLAIDTMGYLNDRQEIDGAIVVAPSGVHINWVTDELPTHWNPDYKIEAMAFKTSSASAKWHENQFKEVLYTPNFAFLAMTYDAWITKAGKKAAWEFMKRRKLITVLDESHRIKTPEAKRTKSIIQGGVYSKYKRILTGTPSTQGPFDLYSQIRFIDPTFWARELQIESFAAFKAFFGIFEESYNRNLERYNKRGEMYRDGSFDLLVDYQNIDVMEQVLKKISSRITKEDAGLSLPPKLYQRRYYEMTPKQRKVYEELEKEYITWLDSQSAVSAELAIVRATRLQQVLCGYVPVDGDQEPTELLSRSENPRLKLLEEVMQDTSGQTIIWAKWTRDIDMILDVLKSMGRNPVRYDGKASEGQRLHAKNAFKGGDATDFVANSAMSEGLTLNEAKYTIYYNNSYKLLDRKQTEDRNHRIGQKASVTYTDLICQGTKDEDVINALIKKDGLAKAILGDRPSDWM